MEFVELNNKIKMPLLGFGTYSLSNYECEKCVSEAINTGYTLIDTAQMYGNEKAIGNAIKHYDRKKLFITTKLYSPSTSYKKAKEAVEKSLNNLQTNYIDLLLIHEPYMESLSMYEAMKEAYSAEKIKSLGISNFNKKQYLNFIKSCEIIPAINQVECHIFYGQKELWEVLKKNNTHMQAWSPLGCARNNFLNNQILISIGKKYNKTAAQIALRYLIQKGISAIPKSSNAKRIKENIDIFNFKIEQEDMMKIQSIDENKSLFGWYK